MPRDCAKLREQLPEYAEGALAGRLRARLEEHLQTCQRCAAELEDLRTIIGAVRSVEPAELPEHLVARVGQAARELAPPVRGLPQLWARVAIPAALVVAAVAVSFALFAPRHRGALAPAGENLRIASGQVPGLAPDSLAEVPPVAPSLSEPPPPVALAAEAEMDVFAPPETIPPASDTVAKGKEVFAPRGPSGRPGGMAGGDAGLAARDEAPCHRCPVVTPGQRVRLKVMGREERDRQEGLGSFAAQAETPPAPSFSAALALTKDDGRPAIALQVGAEQDSGEIAVYLGGPGSRHLMWRGATPTSARILISPDQTGPGPTTVPLTIESAQAKRSYLLFLPTLARLGESAPSAPMGRYQGEPLSQVLSQLSALTGLVLLAEEPLSMEVVGEIPPGTPEASVRQIAADAGLEVQQAGDIVLNLTHRR